jgi:hypothetical protein
MPDVHSKRPASASYRWINCPGSIKLSEKCKAEDTGSDYAKEGTLAHSIAELKLRIATDRTVKADELKTLTKSEYWDGEMDEATDFYRDLVMEHLNAAGDGAELMIEQRVDYSDWVPGGFGTSDAVIIADDTIEIIDLKYGKGIRVDAKDNPQMRLYALGAFQVFGDLYDFDKVKTTICQPRLDHVSSEELTVTELLDWANNVVEPAAKEAESDNPHTAAGDWCRWCPAKAVCRTRAEANLELAKYDFQPGPLLEQAEIAEILGKVDELTKWAFEKGRKVGDFKVISKGDGSTDGEIKNTSGYFDITLYMVSATEYCDKALARDIAYMTFSTEKAAKEAIEEFKKNGKFTRKDLRLLQRQRRQLHRVFLKTALKDR